MSTVTVNFFKLKKETLSQIITYPDDTSSMKMRCYFFVWRKKKLQWPVFTPEGRSDFPLAFKKQICQNKQVYYLGVGPHQVDIIWVTPFHERM